MRVLLDAHYAETFDTPVATEGRWPLNLGHMLALRGHEVKFTRCVADWCSNPPAYDVFFSTYFPDDGHGARVVVHGRCRFDPPTVEARRLGPDHFVAVPYPAVLERLRLDAPLQGWPLEECLSFTRLMPWPCIERIEWERSNAGAPLLTYCAKQVFEEHHLGTPLVAISEEMLHVAIDLAEELGLELHMLRMEDRPCLPDGLRNRIFGGQKSPAVVTHGRIPRRDVLDILRRTRLLFSDTPTDSPISVEAAALGAAVQIWKGGDLDRGFLDYEGRMSFEYKADRNYIRGHVMDSLRRLCTDQKAFRDCLADLRWSARRYTYDGAYPENLSALEGMLDEVGGR